MKRKTETARVDTEILEMKEMNRYLETLPLQGDRDSRKKNDRSLGPFNVSWAFQVYEPLKRLKKGTMKPLCH